MTGQLTLPQVCGQLILGGYVGEEPTGSFRRELEQGHRAGAILFRRNLPNAQAGHAASCTLLECCSSELPPFLAVDQEGGRVARLGEPVLRLPPMLRLAQACSRDLVQKAAAVLARDLMSLGFNVDFAPVLDIHTNPRNPVIGDRSFGSSAQTVVAYATAFLTGLQQEGMVACGKHFPGHGDTDVDSHLDLPVIRASLERLRQVELVPFAAAVQAGLQSIMTAHIVIEGVTQGLPATLSHAVVTDLLRVELGFDGVIFSDDLEMQAIGKMGSIADAAVMAIEAGCDVVTVCKLEDEQVRVHEALVRRAESDPAFRGKCELAARRSVRLRRARPPTPSRSYAEAHAKMTTSDKQVVVQRIAQCLSTHQASGGH